MLKKYQFNFVNKYEKSLSKYVLMLIARKTYKTKEKDMINELLDMEFTKFVSSEPIFRKYLKYIS